MFQILDFCSADMQVLVSAVKTVFTLIQIAIPGVLIVLGTIDMFKAMASGDEKKTKEAQRTFVRRMIYAVVAFLIPFIIRLVFSFIANNIGADEAKAGQNSYNEFFACWNGAKSSSGSGSDSGSTGDCNVCWKDGQSYTGVSRDNCENYMQGYCS
ncbi:MAG: hypothetical protein IJ068_01205 [Bacilli bacterium]|nr:hypothetical protein [Bacilli bacterium]